MVTNQQTSLPLDMLGVMDQYTSNLITAVSSNLVEFSSKFIQNGFITNDTSNDILSQQGCGNKDKASQLINRVRGSYENAADTQLWARKFISIFSRAPYRDLGAVLHKAVFPGETPFAN